MPVSELKKLTNGGLRGAGGGAPLKAPAARGSLGMSHFEAVNMSRCSEISTTERVHAQPAKKARIVQAGIGSKLGSNGY